MALPFMAGATSSTPSQVLTKPEETANRFGWSIARDEEFMIIGAPHDEKNGVREGAAYIYEYYNNSWNLVQRIAAPFIGVQQADAEFGYSVAIDKMANVWYAYVGAPNYDVAGEVDAGAVFVYRHGANGWEHFKTFTQPSGVQSGANFGYAVAADDGLAIVGAPDTVLDGLAGAGAAYVYHVYGVGYDLEINFKRQLTKPNGNEQYAQFGNAVDLEQDVPGTVYTHYLVGAHFADEWGVNSGAAYLFADSYSYHNDDALPYKSLYDPGINASDYFGRSVAISGRIVAVGSIGLDIPGYTNAGGVWVFDAPTVSTTQVIKLWTLLDYNYPLQSNTYFGQSVDVDADFTGGGVDKFHVVTGAPYYDDSGLSSVGASFFLERFSTNNWVFNRRIASDSIEQNAQQGYAVATDGSSAVSTTKGIAKAHAYTTAFPY